MSEKVLIVEDSLTVAYTLKQHLLEWGYETITAESIDETFGQLAENEVDLVLLDVVLPDGSGLDILNNVKNLKSAPAVVVMTGQGTEETVVKAMRAGADDYLTKPIKPSELKRVIEEVSVSRKKRLSKVTSQASVVLIASAISAEAEVLTGALEDGGCRTICADQANEALSRAEAETVDLVLLDAELSDGSGLDMIPEFKELSSSPAVVVISGEGSEATAIKAMRSGADDYLAKPVELNELKAVLDDVLDRRKGELADHIKAKELAEEMAVAAVVQRRLGQPDLPKVDGWDIDAKLKPDRLTAGDIYGIIRNGKLLHIWLGDISGKGTGAAMLSASIRTMIRSQAQEQVDPCEILDRIARVAYEDLVTSNAFLTLFFGTIDTETGAAQLIDAGHSHFRVRRFGGRWEKIDCPPGLPIGFESEPEYRSGSLKLAPGDLLTVYTDGLVEVGDIPDSSVGTRQLEGFINSAANSGVRRITEAVYQGVEQMAQTDDRTLVLLQRLIGLGPVRLVLDVSLSDLDRLSELVQRIGQEASIDAQRRFAIELALTEAFTNVVRHGYPENWPKEHGVLIEIQVKEGEFTSVIEDGGVPFEPDGGEDSDSEPGEGQKGLDVIRATMDEISYKRKDDKNVLRLKMNLS